MTNRLTLTKIALNTSVASLIALSVGSVYAQTAAKAAAKPAEAVVETIVVTGSRIARPDLTSTSPVSVVSAAEFKLSGQVNVENILNALPQVVPGFSASSNNPGNGVATVNLRSLGVSRTLVLVNGRRYISYDTSQVVDLNTVPSALIERVDVVTGGRSAVYGSDAIAGVVNFVLKRNFEGVKFGSEYRFTAKGDGGDWNNDFTLGGNFADGKGNAVVYIGYNKRDAVFQGDRAFSTFAKQDNGDGTLFNGGSGSIPGGRLIGIPGGPKRFLPDGTLVPYKRSTDQYNYAPVNYLQIPLERFTVSTQAHYEINKNLEFFTEAQFINARSKVQLASTPTGAVPVIIQTNSPFLPASVQALLQSADTGNTGYVNASLARRMVETGPRVSANERNAFRVLTGIRGDVIDNWKYEAFYSFARTRNSNIQLGNISFSKYQNSINTVFSDLNPNGAKTSPFPFAGGQLICVSNPTNVPTGCVPANLFGANRLSAEALKYLEVPVQNSDEAQTQVANLTFTNNNLFDLGAGGAGLAIGTEWRKEEAAFNADASLASGDVLGFGPGNATRGSYSVKEFFGEFNLPLLKNLPLAQSLEANAAVRYSTFSIPQTGSVVSWSGGLAYAPVKDITFRGQYQRAIRSPNVADLYTGTFQGSPAASDPCNNTVAGSTDPKIQQLNALCVATGVPVGLLGSVNEVNSQLQANGGGNTNLKAETSNTFTLGVVLQPQFVPHFSITVDYFDIKIKDFIGAIGTTNILNLCYTQQAAQYCSLIKRDPTTGLTTSTPQDGITDITKNSGGVKTKGVDVALNYRTNLNIGNNDSSISFQILGTYTSKFDFTPAADTPSLINVCAGKFGNTCGAPQPKIKTNTRITWDTGPMTISAHWRHLGPVSDDGATLIANGGGNAQIAVPRIGPTNYFDASANFKVGEHLELTAGIDNIGNRYPVILGDNQESANTYTSVYEVLGRKFFVSASVKF